MNLNHALPLFAALGLLIGASACKEAAAKTKGVGDSFQPFIVKNCNSGDRYCQVCAYGGKPTIMVVADLKDKKTEADLKKVQALIKEHGGKGLTAFALFGEFKNGKFSPVADDEAASKALDAMSKKLGLSFPVTVVPTKYTAKEAKSYAAFVDAYDIRTSRTVMFADAGNKVLFAQTINDKDAQAQYTKLADAVKKGM